MSFSMTFVAMTFVAMTFVERIAVSAFARRPLAVVFLGIALCSPLHASPPDNETRLQLGKRIYREGVLPSGELLTATGQGGISVRGKQAACVNCHRRSGLGSAEGGRVIRSIAGAMLYRHVEAPAPRAPQKGLAGRVPYTDDALVKAIREGVDSTGRTLDGLMPRYALDAEDAKLLVAYLKSLSSGPSAGVTQETVHFATIVAPGAAPEKRKAMLDVLHAYFRDKNAGTRHEVKRSAHAPWDMAREYRAYRKWALHVWELSGPAETWPVQLEAYYRKQPVFAVLSGIGEGSWRPALEFFERQELPCLFPNTDLPAISETGFYSVYFSKGMTLEAQVLAKHLQGDASEPVIQVYRDGESGAVAAATLRQALPGRVFDRRIEPGARPTAAFWEEVLHAAQSSSLVLWLGDEDVRAFNAAAMAAPQPKGIYLSSSLTTATTGGLPQARLYFIRPFDLPQVLDRRLVRVRTWLRARNLATGDEQVQTNTYFAATVAGEALMYLVDNFSRDYFVERIEDMLDNALAATIYPRTTLGPGQRFASKGSYIVRFSDSAPSLQPVGGWIVP
jgi:mono/diheme cytochrome c family protein